MRDYTSYAEYEGIEMFSQDTIRKKIKSDIKYRLYDNALVAELAQVSRATVFRWLKGDCDLSYDSMFDLIKGLEMYKENGWRF